MSRQSLSLTDPITKIGRITQPRLEALSKLRITTVRDLLYHFPTRHSLVAHTTRIIELAPATLATVYVTVLDIEQKQGWYGNKPSITAIVSDISGDQMQLRWFNQPFVLHSLSVGSNIQVIGMVTVKPGGRPTMINPRFEKISVLPIDGGNSLFSDEDEPGTELGSPVYPESKGITSLWISRAVHKALELLSLEESDDPVPLPVRTSLKLPSLLQALWFIHMPRTKNQYQSAHKRFSFEYIFTVSIVRARQRHQFQHQLATSFSVSNPQLSTLLGRLPFTLTAGQERVINSIRTDLSKTIPMSRLLEGDVGSGKTAIASICAGIIELAGNHTRDGYVQTAYMAPTEVLANQLFEHFISFFRSSGTPILLLTGSGAKKFPSKSLPTQATSVSKAQALKWITNGEIAVIIGTHSLIQKKVVYNQLGLVIVDEQHRFGTGQRALLANRDGHVPHYLSMSATPMPRTLALTLYGDLDISVLDEVPPGRKPVETIIVAPHDRPETYRKIAERLTEGRQMYVICPRIDDPDPEKEQALTAKSALSEAKRLAKDVFPQFRIAVMHGKLTSAQKESIMSAFSAHEYDILVSTSVIEVGVNVPNSTMIIIEGAERFGLSQLHQLRGRVMRGTHQPYCYLFAESKSEKTTQRLGAFVRAKNGFELAEHDLRFRGTGDLLGLKQWGVSDIGMEALQNIKLVEAARTSASEIVFANPDISDYPALQRVTDELLRQSSVHFE